MFSLLNGSDEDKNKLPSQGCHYLDPYNENIKHECLKGKDGNLDTLNINIQSFIGKKKLIGTSKQHIIIHVTLLSETIINTTNIDHSAIPGYKKYHSIRDKRKAGGVEHFILDEIYCTGKINVIMVDSYIMESCFANTKVNNKLVVLEELCGMYGIDLKKIIDYYMEMIKYITNKQTLILGTIIILSI